MAVRIGKGIEETHSALLIVIHEGGRVIPDRRLSAARVRRIKRDDRLRSDLRPGAVRRLRDGKPDGKLRLIRLRRSAVSHQIAILRTAVFKRALDDGSRSEIFIPAAFRAAERDRLFPVRPALVCALFKRRFAHGDHIVLFPGSLVCRIEQPTRSVLFKGIGVVDVMPAFRDGKPVNSLRVAARRIPAGRISAGCISGVIGRHACRHHADRSAHRKSAENCKQIFLFHFGLLLS